MTVYERATQAVGSEHYDFYRCKKCFRLISLLEFTESLEQQRGHACPCGSLKVAACNLTWEDYALPQVIRYSRAVFGDTADLQMREDLLLEMKAADQPEAVKVRALAALEQAQREIPA